MATRLFDELAEFEEAITDKETRSTVVLLEHPCFTNRRMLSMPMPVRTALRECACSAVRPQPALRSCRLPVGPQQMEEVFGQHHAAALAALALLDPEVASECSVQQNPAA